MNQRIRQLICLLTISLTLTTSSVLAQCGLDIFIANDQSGSIDAREDRQGKTFIYNLAQNLSLGTANDKSRLAIANWSTTDTWTQYTFPVAGKNFTALQSDVMTYPLSPFNLGYTDPYDALRRTYAQINQTPVSGRNVSKLIILMTDARCDQIQPGIVQLATQIKQSGVYVMVLAIDDAYNCSILQGTNVASPGMFFRAPSYADLASTAQTYINSIVASMCSNTSLAWDLKVNLTQANCTTGSVNYTVSNAGNTAFSGNTLHVAFYDGDPALGTSRLLATTTQSTSPIAAGAANSYTYTNAALIGKGRIYAVVNINPAMAATPVPLNIAGRLAVTGEGSTTNNISTAFSATGCSTSGPRLEVTKTSAGVSCDKLVTYNVQVCNTGVVDASNVSIADIPGSSDFKLVSATINYGNGTGNGVITSTSAPANYQHPQALGDAADVNTAHSDGQNRLSTFIDYVIVGSERETEPPYRTSPFRPRFRFIPATNGGMTQGSVIESAKLTIYINRKNMSGSFNVLGTKQTALTAFNQANLIAPSSVSGDAPLPSPTLASQTVTLSSGSPGNAYFMYEVDIKDIIQEIVNESGWNAATSAIGLFFQTTGTNLQYVTSQAGSGSTPSNLPNIATFENTNATYRPKLDITYRSAPSLPAVTTLPAGQCITASFIFDASTAPAGTYHNSVSVSTTTPNPTYLPDAGFSISGGAGTLNGFDGTKHTTDNVNIPAATNCNQSPQALTTTVTIPPASICAGGGGYTTATVTINNPNTSSAGGSGVSIFNAINQLNLTGPGAAFASEPYNFTSSTSSLLQIAQPNTLDPAYPAVPNALFGKNGVQSLQLYEIPPGTHTFKIDISGGLATLGLSNKIINIPTTYNSNGTAESSTASVSIITPPVPLFTTCPAPVPVTATTVSLVATISSSTYDSLSWSSTGGASMSVSGTATSKNVLYTITDADRARGFVDIRLRVMRAGCDNAATCRISIYGQMLTNPDFNVTTPGQPVAGSVATNDSVPAGSQYTNPVGSPSNPSGGVISVNPDGTYVFTGTTPGEYVYTVTVCSPTPNSVCTTEELTITVTNPGLNNNPPIAHPDIAVIKGAPASPGSVTINVIANDAPGNAGGTLGQPSIVTNGQHGNAVVSGNNLVYTPAAGFYGKDTLYYRICETPSNLCDTERVVITVLEPGVAGAISPAEDYNSVYSGKTLSVTAANGVLANDRTTNAGTLTATAQSITLPGKGTFILNTNGSYSFASVPGFTGTVNLPYRMCDGTICDSSTLHILVKPFDTEPDFNVTTPGVTVIGNTATNDNTPSGTIYSQPVASPGNPSGGDLQLANDGTYSFSATTPGEYNYTIQVCTPDAVCTSELLTITVNNPSATDNPPIAHPDVVTTTGSGSSPSPVTINVKANDEPGNTGGTLGNPTIVTNPSNGTAVITGGNVAYTPNPGFYGNDTLYYQVCESPSGLCDTEMVVITVQEPGSQKQVDALDDYKSGYAGTTISADAAGGVLANDKTTGAGPLTAVAQSTTLPGKGTFTLNTDGSYSFVPVASFTGTVDLPYRACDGTACDSATLHLLIKASPAIDLMPTVTRPFSSSIGTGQTVEGVIRISNISINNSTGPITFYVEVGATLGLEFIPNATNSAGVAVKNEDWIITDYGYGFFMLTSKPGVVLNAQSSKSIGYKLTSFGAGGSSSVLIVNIQNNTGGNTAASGDNNKSNNNVNKVFSTTN